MLGTPLRDSSRGWLDGVPIRHDRRLLAVPLICALALLAACGGSSVTAEKASQAHFGALANAICREAQASKASRASSFLAQRNTELARVHALLNSARDLHLVSTYIADLAAQKRLRSEMSAAASDGSLVSPGESPPLHRVHLPDAMSDIEDAYQLSVKLRDDEKALGMSACIGRPPRPPIGG
jgi:hypothetical protein